MSPFFCLPPPEILLIQTDKDLLFIHVERFADLQILRYEVPGFEELSLRQKELVYYLSEAALCGRDILFDQNGRYNLRIRRTLEAIYTGYRGDRQSADFLALEVYLKRVWFSSGIHHHYGCEKFVPGFSEEFFRQAVGSVAEGQAVEGLPGEFMPLPLADGQTVDQLLDELVPVIFNPTVMPKRVNQADGEDLLLTSACHYYEGVTQQEAEDFYAAMKDPTDPAPPSYGLNSLLFKEGPEGRIGERVWCIGGMYTQALERIVYWLRRAMDVADTPRQREVIGKLIAYYRTGDLRTFDDYAILWVQDVDSHVDFINGFTETYGDPLGLKASWEALVDFKDLEATRRTQLISDNAQWFEDHSPVDPRFRKPRVRGVSAKVITAAILAGDLYPATAIGINLPNADWIRRQHGSKSVTISNITHAYNLAARGNGFHEEFVCGPTELDLLNRYGELTGNLHTDLHECLGHGSGQLLPGVDPDALRAYGATIEEARADLFGLYYMADPRLVELGLLPDGEAYKAEYYSYLMNGLLTQLVRIEPGHQVEEAHMRNRQLIARWVYEHASATSSTTRPAVELVRRNDKTYVIVNDYPALHTEVLARYRRLDLAPYKGFVNPRYTPVTDPEGRITDILLTCNETYTAQMLRYSRDYSFLPSVNP